MSKENNENGKDKEIKKWLESFSREEWIKKLDRQKYLYELRKWLELKEDNIKISNFEYEESMEDRGKFVWTKDKYNKSLKKDDFSDFDLKVFKLLLEAA